MIMQIEIPGYSIERLIAEGGMASVYLARQESLDRHVVLKVLRRFDDPEQAARFLNEARTVAALQHRHVITIHDVGVFEERHYIAMEYLEGGSLRDRIGQGTGPDAALDLVESIAGCLQFVHARQVVHGDIKPSNILFHPDDTPKLTDFGIARPIDGDQQRSSHGSVFGSPLYLCPEQAEGGRIDGRADIYALGIVFYQMLTGHLPYAESSPIETILAHQSRPIPLLPDALSRYQGLLEGMLAKRAAERFSSAADLVEAVHKVRRNALQRAADAFRHLTASSSGSPPAKRPPRWVGAGGPLLAAVGCIAIAVPAVSFVRQYDPPTADDDVRTVEEAVSETADLAERPSTVTAGAGVAKVEVTPVAGDERRSAETGTRTERAAAAAVAATEPAAASPVDMGGDVSIDTPPAVSSLAGAAVTENPLVDIHGRAAEDRQRIEGLMESGDRALQANRLTTPVQDSAFFHYSKVLELVPGHPGATAGMTRIADRYVALARKALGAGDFQRADLYARRGLRVRGDHPGLELLRNEIVAAQQRPAAGQVAASDTTQPVPSTETVSLRGREGTGNIFKDFRDVVRSIFN